MLMNRDAYRADDPEHTNGSSIDNSRQKRRRVSLRPVGSKLYGLGRARPSGLLVAAQHDRHSYEVKQRGRQQEDPAEHSQRRYGQDVRDVGEQVGKTYSGCDGKPDWLLPPAPERDGLSESERSP